MIFTFNVLNCFKVGVFTGWAELFLLRGLGPALTKLCGSPKLGRFPKVMVWNGQLLFIYFTYQVPRELGRLMLCIQVPSFYINIHVTTVSSFYINGA